MDQKITHLVKTLEKTIIASMFNKWKAAIGAKKQ